MQSLKSENSILESLNISRTTLWRLRQNGLPFVRIGRRVMFDPAKVMAWIEEHGTETTLKAA